MRRATERQAWQAPECAAVALALALALVMAMAGCATGADRGEAAGEARAATVEGGFTVSVLLDPYFVAIAKVDEEEVTSVKSRLDVAPGWHNLHVYVGDNPTKYAAAYRCDLSLECAAAHHYTLRFMEGTSYSIRFAVEDQVEGRKRNRWLTQASCTERTELWPVTPVTH